MSLNKSVAKIKDIVAPRRSGDSLITACCIGDMDTVVIILLGGGDPNYQDANGRTPLHFACIYGHERIVYYLLYKGASLKSTKSGQTPLHAATLHNRNKIVHILLQYIESNKNDDEQNNVDINLINSKTLSGLTALHIAANMGSLEMVKILLTFGAIYSIRDVTQKNPKDVTRNEKIVNFFELVDELFEDVQNGDIAVINKLNEFTDDTFSVLFNARNEDDKTLYMIALDTNNELVGELVNLIPAFKMDQFEYLKKASYHILKSMIQLSMEGNSVGSYNMFAVQYLKNVYILVSQYKIWASGTIKNKEIAILNNILKSLKYDPRNITADAADSFVSKRENVHFYDNYGEGRGLKQILELVNKHVKEFFESIKTELRALYFDHLVQACKIGDSLDVELLLTRIRNESPDSVEGSEETAPLFEYMYYLEPHTVVTLKSDGLTLVQIAAVNGHLEVIKTLLIYGAVYNSGYYEGKTPKNLSTNQDVIDFLSLVDCIFHDVEKGDINVLKKLSAKKKDDLKAVTCARNLQGHSLLEVAEKKKHINIVRELGKIIIFAWKS